MLHSSIISPYSSFCVFLLPFFPLRVFPCSELVGEVGVYRGGDSYSKVEGLMRCEARQRAIARCDLGGLGACRIFGGGFQGI